mmetsp:Transcript_5339/g.8414  ORF Transcript_5339/g.8414 Transcript_5339/m.8414 type:complete len:180 (-) Transcript_5339:121-660(-)
MNRSTVTISPILTLMTRKSISFLLIRIMKRRRGFCPVQPKKNNPIPGSIPESSNGAEKEEELNKAFSVDMDNEKEEPLPSSTKTNNPDSSYNNCVPVQPEEKTFAGETKTAQVNSPITLKKLAGVSKSYGIDMKSLQALRENDVDDDDLPEMTKSDFKDLCGLKAGQILRIMKAAKTFK